MTTNIALEKSKEDFVKQAVSEVLYASEMEVVTEALRLVKAQDCKPTELRASIQESLKDITLISPEEMDRDLEEQEAQ
jgi:putative addiction module CopG family antidote